MPEPLKNRYTPEFIQAFCLKLQTIYPEFDTHNFLRFVFNKDWENKELKARMRHITLGLGEFLPKNYQQSMVILTTTCQQLAPSMNGFLLMFLPDFVEVFGLDNYQTSIKALAIFTPITSSEFAIRAFIQKYPQQTMSQMQQWANSDNEHLRRLASEGCRPKLPWARTLPEFRKNPSAILPILTHLKNDPSEYVRRSVANNLNDISKDNPDIVIKIAQKWLGKSAQTDKLIKHASRTLLKKADPKIMKLFNFQPPRRLKVRHFTCDKKVKIGEGFNFSFEIIAQQSLGLLRIEYAIYFLKNNSQQHRKIFKISESNNQNSKKLVRKTHSFKVISTRKYHAGKHKLGVIINGVEQLSKTFFLTI